MKTLLSHLMIGLGVSLLFIPAMGQNLSEGNVADDFILFNIDFVDSLNGWMAGEVVPYRG